LWLSQDRYGFAVLHLWFAYCFSVLCNSFAWFNVCIVRRDRLKRFCLLWHVTIVCPSVCMPSVTLVLPVKAVGQNEMPFGRDALVFPINIVLERVPSPPPPLEGEIWGSETPVHSSAVCCWITLAFGNLQITKASFMDVDESSLNGYIAGCSSVLGRLPVDTAECPLTLYQKVVASVRNNYQVRFNVLLPLPRRYVFVAVCMSVCLFLCMCFCLCVYVYKISQKMWVDFDEIFWRGRHVSGSIWLDFGGYLDPFSLFCPSFSLP